MIINLSSRRTADRIVSNAEQNSSDATEGSGKQENHSPTPHKVKTGFLVLAPDAQFYCLGLSSSPWGICSQMLVRVCLKAL